MDSQLKTEKQKLASRNASVATGALVRLALLVGPETVVMKTLAHNPVACVLLGLLVLALWLSVDIGPFRAKVAKPAAEPASVRPTSAVLPRLTRVQFWTYLFCKLAIVCAMFHSKISI
jgi:hypothetical protein